MGNFAITVVLLQKFAEMAAKYIPQWEIIDYASDGKKDAPSGTVRELANAGSPRSRGDPTDGLGFHAVHSVRLPAYVVRAGDHQRETGPAARASGTTQGTAPGPR